MTKSEARQQLKRIHKDRCSCGDKHLRVAFHNSKCPYRMAAFMREALRPFVGPLYQVDLPDAA